MTQTPKELSALLQDKGPVPLLVCDRHPLSMIDTVQPQFSAALAAWSRMRKGGVPPCPDNGYRACLAAVGAPMAVNLGFVGRGWTVEPADVDDPISVRALGHAVGPDVLLDLAREDARAVAVTRTPSLATIVFDDIRVDQLILPFATQGSRTTTVLVMSLRAASTPDA